MRLFDTHCHFDFAPFASNFPAELELAKQQGVERFLIPSIAPSNWREVTRLSKVYPDIYYALGFHPYFLDTDQPVNQALLEQWLTLRSKKCVAIGECGLDGMINVDRELQEFAFLAQLRLAKTFQLPLIIHARKTHNRLIQLIKKERFQFGGILHGFSGSYQQAMQFVELGFFIGVGGVITYPRAKKTRQAVSQLPEEVLVLETDAPDMPLSGFQGKVNHPKMLPKTLVCLAELRNTSAQTFANILWKNSNLALNICE